MCMRKFQRPRVIPSLLVLLFATGHTSADVEPLVPLFPGPVFQGDAPDETHPWAVHDRNRPQPPRVEPGTFSNQQAPGQPPSDAIVLFDGSEESLKNWESVREDGAAPMEWKVEDGALVVVPRTRNIRTKEHFGDVQLHLEWQVPVGTEGTSQGRANSGVFFAGDTEIQILGNYNNPTYADGFAGSVYGVKPPMVNPLRPDGEWQTYDIVFRRPVFKDGVEVDPGHFTVFVNGVLVQDATPLEGGGGFMKRSRPREFPEAGPIMLQDHGDVLRFRNIWVRPLPPRAVEGGTDGQLSPEATTAKRAEIAAGIRAHAATLEGREKMMRYLESLAYEVDEDTLALVEPMKSAEVESIQALSAEALEANKGGILEFHRALNYLARFDALPEEDPARVAINALVETQGWNRR